LVLRLAALILLLGLTVPVSAETLNSCLECHSRVVLSHGFVADSPVALMDCVGCHRGNPQTRRKDLAHSQRIDADYAWFRLDDTPIMTAARQSIDRFACRRCHVQNRKGNTLAADLDQLLDQRSVDELVQALLEPAYYMPDFALGEEDRQLVILALLAGGIEPLQQDGDDVTIVHFENPVSEERPFEKHCGACHRVLTPHLGGLGADTIAPNLSGLLTPFYLKNFKDNQLWTTDGLMRWIKNPRQIRPLAVMPPLDLNDQQVHKLIDNTWPATQGELHP